MTVDLIWGVIFIFVSRESVTQSWLTYRLLLVYVSTLNESFIEPLQTVFYIFADSSFVPPLIYAVLGSSRDLAVGPVSIASLVMGSMLREAVSPDDTAVYIQLAFTATFFAGVFQASLGLFRCVMD